MSMLIKGEKIMKLNILHTIASKTAQIAASALFVLSLPAAGDSGCSTSEYEGYRNACSRRYDSPSYSTCVSFAKNMCSNSSIAKEQREQDRNKRSGSSGSPSPSNNGSNSSSYNGGGSNSNSGGNDGQAVDAGNSCFRSEIIGKGTGYINIHNDCGAKMVIEGFKCTEEGYYVHYDGSPTTILGCQKTQFYCAGGSGFTVGNVSLIGENKICVN